MGGGEASPKKRDMLLRLLEKENSKHTVSSAELGYISPSPTAQHVTYPVPITCHSSHHRFSSLHGGWRRAVRSPQESCSGLAFAHSHLTCNRIPPHTRHVRRRLTRIVAWSSRLAFSYTAEWKRRATIFYSVAMTILMSWRPDSTAKSGRISRVW